MIRAVIFDLDGTLTNTIPVCFAAFRATLRTYLGREYSDPEIESLFGPSEEGVFRTLMPDRWEEAYHDFLDRYEENHFLAEAPFLGVITLLDWLRERNIATGIVTGKGAGSAAISLRRTGLAGHFDAVEAGSAQGAVKPAAIARLLALRNISPSDAAYVGDAPYDVRAAREAGVTPLSALWAPTSHPDRVAAEKPEAAFNTPAALQTWLAQRIASE